MWAMLSRYQANRTRRTRQRAAESRRRSGRTESLGREGLPAFHAKRSHKQPNAFKKKRTASPPANSTIPSTIANQPNEPTTATAKKPSPRAPPSSNACSRQNENHHHRRRLYEDRQREAFVRTTHQTRKTAFPDAVERTREVWRRGSQHRAGLGPPHGSESTRQTTAWFHQAQPLLPPPSMPTREPPALPTSYHSSFAIRAKENKVNAPEFIEDPRPNATNATDSHVVLMSHGFKVTIIDRPTAIFVVDMVPKHICNLIKRLTDEHFYRMHHLGDQSKQGWRTLYTYTKMDLPCNDVDNLKGVTSKIIADLKLVIGDLFGEPEAASHLRPRSWKEPHLLLYQSVPGHR